MKLWLDHLDSPVGTLTLVSDGDALRALTFPNGHEDWLARHLQQYYRDCELVSARDAGGFTVRLEAYFAGNLAAIDAIPAAPAGSDFHRAVWALLREIPVGATTTYGALAKKLGKLPSASRAIGLAVGSNPVAIVVPCHRVVGANDKLTGFGGGIPRKAWLLAHERVLLPLALP